MARDAQDTQEQTIVLAVDKLSGSVQAGRHSVSASLSATSTPADCSSRDAKAQRQQSTTSSRDRRADSPHRRTSKQRARAATGARAAEHESVKDGARGKTVYSEIYHPPMGDKRCVQRPFVRRWVAREGLDAGELPEAGWSEGHASRAAL